MYAENRPLSSTKRVLGRRHGPPPFLKSYLFARDVFLVICFDLILQGIQNFLGPSIPKFIVLSLLEETFVSRKIKSFTHFTPTAFSEHQFFLSRKREDYGAEKMTKAKLVRVLVTYFDKFHNLCNLSIFYFCFVVP